MDRGFGFRKHRREDHHQYLGYGAGANHMVNTEMQRQCPGKVVR